MVNHGRDRLYHADSRSNTPPPTGYKLRRSKAFRHFSQDRWAGGGCQENSWECGRTAGQSHVTPTDGQRSTRPGSGGVPGSRGTKKRRSSCHRSSQRCTDFESDFDTPLHVEQQSRTQNLCKSVKICVKSFFALSSWPHVLSIRFTAWPRCGTPGNRSPISGHTPRKPMVGIC